MRRVEDLSSAFKLGAKFAVSRPDCARSAPGSSRSPMACYYIVISSTHLSNGHFRNIKGVFRGPLSKNGSKNLDYAGKEKTMTKALEDLKANFYCELCDKQYYKHQEFDNHINSYDHAHTQRLKELKQREFARNVASKLRKDERKQERALKRLHELAEQRREVQCAPGSGPKFRSTTVAVEGGSREACCEGNVAGSQPVTAQTTGAQKNAWNTNSNKLVQWPYPGKLKKQMHRQKIAFSISLPKRASIRLEASAPVFCENMEDGLAALSSKQRLRAAADKFSLLSTPAVGNALNYGEAIYGGDTNMDLISQEKICSNTHITSEVSTNQASPDLTSDLCALLVYSADVSSPCIAPSTFPFHIKDAGIVLHMEDPQTSLRCENIERKCETVQDIGSESKLDNDAVEENQSINTDSSSSNETTAATASCEENVVDLDSGAPLSFTKPSQPFSSVLSKDGSTVLQWPSEMLSFTRAVPSLSFSCNPLYFDFRASRTRTEQGTTWVKENDPNHTAPLQEAQDGIDSAKPEASLCSDEHIQEPAYKLDSSLGQKGSCLPGPPGHQDLTAPVVVKDDHNGTNEIGCLRPLERDDNQTKKSFREQKVTKEEDLSNERSTGKLWGRNRRNYRSHKRRQRTSKRKLYREHGRNNREAEKFTSVLSRRSECWDDSDEEFCSDNLQQLPPSDESKQSSQNQEETSSDASKVDTTGRGRWKGAGAVKGTVCCQPSCSGDRERLDCGTINQRDAVEKQADITGSCPHCLPIPQPEKHRTLEAQSPPCGQSIRQNSLKRKHGVSSDEEEEGCRPPTDRHLLAGGSRRLELFSKVDSFESDSRICCRLERIRKRQRASLAYHGPITDWGAASKEKHMPKVPAESISLSSAIQSPMHQKTQTNVPEKDMNEAQSWPDKDLRSDMGHDTHLLDSVTQGLPVDKCAESSGCPSGTQIKVAGPNSSPYQYTVPGDLNLTENMSPKNDVRSASPFNNTEPNVVTSDKQEHDEPPTKASGWQPEVRVAMQQSSESMSHGKSFHQCQPPKRPLCFKGQEERISHEVLMRENPGGAFSSTPQGFQHPSDTTDKCCLPQAQAHRRAPRPRARFRSKLKPVLAGPPIQVHSPILHHVHLPPPMSTTSITIHHTILQHHTTLLQPQSPLFSQVFPITPPPMATEICAPGPPAFIPSPELSVVAPAALHPVAMTFHALPRSGLIPAMLPPHPTLYPLQPLF